MKLRISAETKAQIEKRLGRNADELRLVVASAWVSEPTDVTEQDTALLAAMKAAGLEQAGPPMLSNGRPTVMRMVAWMAHEGKNRNGLFFVKDELPAAAAKVNVANALVMDFNHSAVLGWSYEPKAIGYWHSAEYRRDPKALDGKGAFGILLTGTMWSWAFPEHADKLLAEQSRNGKIDFSMACLPESVEFGRDADGSYEIAHNPTFFTLSALDVPPADPDAIGVGVEGSNDAEIDKTLTEQLTGEVSIEAAALKEEEDMKELQEQITALKAQIEGNAAAVAKLAEVEVALEAATKKVAELEQQLADATKTEETPAAETPTDENTPAENTPTVETVQAQLDEVTVAKDGLAAELVAAQSKIEELETALKTATDKLAEVAEAEAKAAKETRLASRIAELPKSYLAAFAKRPEEKQTEMKARWSEMSDVEWAGVKEMLGVADPAFHMSYLALSQSEGGTLPVSTPDASDIDSKLAKIRR